MTDSIPVRQEDRETAAAMWTALGPVGWAYYQADWMRDGTADYGPVVQAFARHAEQARIEERERCCTVVGSLVGCGTSATDYLSAAVADMLKTYIRNGKQS
jgi:hypothetical protein